MNPIQKRFVFFIFGCITTRIVFVYVAKEINPKYLPWLGGLALFPMFGWLYLYYVIFNKEFKKELDALMVGLPVKPDLFMLKKGGSSWSTLFLSLVFIVSSF